MKMDWSTSLSVLGQELEVQRELVYEVVVEVPMAQKEACLISLVEVIFLVGGEGVILDQQLELCDEVSKLQPIKYSIFLKGLTTW